MLSTVNARIQDTHDSGGRYVYV